MRGCNALSPNGFFMTEFLIYLALSACMALFIMQYIFGTIARLRTTTAQTDRIASVYAALDAVAHDLEQAPRTVAAWSILTQNELSWQQGDLILNWKLDRGALKRRSSTFSHNENRWKRAVTHLALEEVEAMHCLPHYQEKNLAAITVAITGRLGFDKTYQCKRTILLKSES